MIDLEALTGMQFAQAARVLDAAAQPWREVPYAGPRGPVEGADSVRVVRARPGPDGAIELTTCAFRTSVCQG